LGFFIPLFWMMSRFLFVLAYLLCFGKAKAQNDTSLSARERIFFSFAAGAAFPTYWFTQNDPYPAQIGRAYDVALRFQSSKSFGIILSYSHTINQTSIPSGTQTYNNYYGGMGNPNKSYDYVYWSGPWLTDNVCLGLTLRAGLENVKIIFKASGGIQQVTAPPVHVYYPGRNVSVEYGEDQAQSFVFSAGFGWQARLKKKLFFVGGLDFYDSVIDRPSISDPQKNIIFLAATVGLAYSMW
jgi:hypothetical protein